MHDDKNSIYVLAIICILAIVAIVYFVGNYVQEHPTTTSSMVLDTSGQAYSASLSNPPMKQYTYSDPCSYRYIVNKLPNADCPK